MSTAYFVMAHKNAAQVLRLCDRLAPSPVVLHVDANAPDDVFAPIAEAAPANVRLLDRRAMPWTGWGQVEVMLEGLERALETGSGHLALLSGQDYPLRPSAAIDAFLDEHDASFVQWFRLPSKIWGPLRGLDRVHLVNQVRNGRDRRILPIPRRMPRGLKPYGGSQFFTITRAAAEHVFAYVRDHPEVVRFYQRTWMPNEMFVQTLLANSPHAARNVNENLWHIEWPPEPVSSPPVITTESIDRLRASASGPSDTGGHARVKLFARKFDADVDERVLDRIDEELLGQPEGARNTQSR